MEEKEPAWFTASIIILLLGLIGAFWLFQGIFPNPPPALDTPNPPSPQVLDK